MKVRTATWALAPPLLWAFLAGLVAMTPSCAASAGARRPAERAFMPIGGPTSVPNGWVDFCRRYHGECDGGLIVPRDINLTPQMMQVIDRVNKWVNAYVKPVSDPEQWGVIDQWDYPYDRRGDCEDYALFKRKILIEEGLPRQGLLMTVVKDEQDVGHAILTVKTNSGEFVLDNLNDEVKPWNRTGYRFVKRQSQADQNLWVQIGDPTTTPDYVSH